MLCLFAVTYQNEGIASEAGSSTIRERLQLFLVFCTIGKGFIYIEILCQLEYRGVICQDRGALGEGISSAINRFIDIDMYVVPSHGWSSGIYLGEIV